MLFLCFVPVKLLLLSEYALDYVRDILGAILEICPGPYRPYQKPQSKQVDARLLTMGTFFSKWTFHPLKDYQIRALFLYRPGKEHSVYLQIPVEIRGFADFCRKEQKHEIDAIDISQESQREQHPGELKKQAEDNEIHIEKRMPG